MKGFEKLLNQERNYDKFYKLLKQEGYEKFWKLLKQGKECKQEIFEKFCKLSKQATKVLETFKEKQSKASKQASMKSFRNFLSKANKNSGKYLVKRVLLF